MLNMMMSDLQRIFRGKGIWITLGLYVFIIFMHVFSAAGPAEGLSRAGIYMAAHMMFISDNIFYFMLPIIIFIAAEDFDTNVAKNILASGTSRTKYYISKLLLASAFCVLLFSLHIVGPILLSTLVHGFGGDFNMAFVLDVLRPALAQLFLLLAVTCIGMFLVFTTKRKSAVIGIYIAFTMVPITIIMILTSFYEGFEVLLDFEVVTQIRTLLTLDDASHSQLLRIFVMGIGYMLISTVSGIVLFKKAEIK